MIFTHNKKSFFIGTIANIVLGYSDCHFTFLYNQQNNNNKSNKSLSEDSLPTCINYSLHHHKYSFHRYYLKCRNLTFCTFCHSSPLTFWRELLQKQDCEGKQVAEPKYVWIHNLIDQTYIDSYLHILIIKHILSYYISKKRDKFHYLHRNTLVCNKAKTNFRKHVLTIFIKNLI